MHKNGIGQSCRKYSVHDVRYERKQREFCFHNIISCSNHLAQRNRSDNTDSWCELFLAKEADVQILGDRITKNFDTGSFDDLAIFSTLAFTPESDQVQISPASSPVIFHHTLWRTWLFLAYSDEKRLCYQIFIASLKNSSIKGWPENVLFELGSERVKNQLCYSSVIWYFHTAELFIGLNWFACTVQCSCLYDIVVFNGLRGLVEETRDKTDQTRPLLLL